MDLKDKSIIVTKYNHSTLGQFLPGWQKQANYIITDDGGAIFSNRNELIYFCELERDLIRQLQSLVCDRALPISYSPHRYTIELMLTEKAIKLRLWFRTKQHFYSYKERLSQSFSIQVLPQIGTDFSKLPSGASTDQFFGFLDILPRHSGRENALAWLIQHKHL